MGRIIAFAIWSLLGVAIIALGVYAAFSKKPMGFWANAKVFEVTDVKRYNRAVSKLFCVYGAVLIVLGLPLLAGQNSPWILLSILGIMVETIVIMAVYTQVVEKKYRKKSEN